MSLLTHTAFFQRAATRDLALAANIAGQQIGLLYCAHGAASDWANSLTYPVRHLINAATNALKIIMGCGLLLAAVFYYPLESVPQVMSALGNEIMAFGLNVLNIALSAISIATRTLASIFSFPFIHNSMMQLDLVDYDNGLATTIAASGTQLSYSPTAAL